MTRSPVDDFEHPDIPEGHPLRPHVLYRLRREDWLRHALVEEPAVLALVVGRVVPAQHLAGVQQVRVGLALEGELELVDLLHPAALDRELCGLKIGRPASCSSMIAISRSSLV